MAEILNIPQSQLSKIENQSGNITYSTIKKIKEYDPKADIEYILGYRDEPIGIDVIESEVIKTKNKEIDQLKKDLEYNKSIVRSMQEILELLKEK